MKAKISADKVRKLKNIALSEKSNQGNDRVVEVSVKKKLHNFRKVESHNINYFFYNNDRRN